MHRYLNLQNRSPGKSTQRRWWDFRVESFRRIPNSQWSHSPNGSAQKTVPTIMQWIRRLVLISLHRTFIGTLSIYYDAVCSCIERLLHTRGTKFKENEMNSRGMNKRQHNVFKPRELKTVNGRLKTSEWKFICCPLFIAQYLLQSLEGDIYCALNLLHSFMSMGGMVKQMVN